MSVSPSSALFGTFGAVLLALSLLLALVATPALAARTFTGVEMTGFQKEGEGQSGRI